MLSVSNNYKFENFAELISKAFNARTKETLIDILYEHLPKIFEGKVFVMLPVPLEEHKVQIEVPASINISSEEQQSLNKIKAYYEADNSEYPTVIDNWFVTLVTLKAKTAFLFVVENKAIKNADLHDEHKDDILSVVAAIFFRIEELEEELEKNIKLQQEKLRTQILSSVSHDLKTPLAAIIGSLNILTSMESKITAEQKKDLIETSISEAHRLNYFITNILRMARIESGGVKTNMEWHNVEDVIKHIEKRFKGKYPDRMLLVKKIDDHISFNIDAALFEQIMMNILDNAVKYSPADIEVELNVKERVALNFIIRDDGKGVPEEMLEKIFDKYSRLELGDRQIAGTGLGLAIAKALADLQKMSISACNHKDGGLVITLSCPEWKE